MSNVMLVEYSQKLQSFDSGRDAVCRLFVAPDDLEEMVRTADRHDWLLSNGASTCLIWHSRCTREGAFTRLAAELESGYLGQDWTGCLCLRDLRNHSWSPSNPWFPMSLADFLASEESFLSVLSFSVSE